MTEERKRAKETKEIDLIDLIIDILLHWRGLIIATLVGGILLGGYGYYSSYKSNKAAVAAAAAEEKVKAELQVNKESLAAQIEGLKDSLEAKDLASATQMLEYNEELKRQKQYNETSILMRADAFNMPTGSVVFRVVAADGEISSLEEAYKSTLTSPDMFNELKGKLGYGSEVYELITRVSTGVSISTEIKSEELNAKETIISYRIKALTEEDCEALVDAFIEYAGKKSSEYQKTFGLHELIVVDSSVSLAYDGEVEAAQRVTSANLASFESMIIRGYGELTDDGKKYYDLAAQYDVTSEKIEQMSVSSNGSSVSVPPVKISKKNLLIGLAGGFFIYALCICVAYILSHKVKDSDEFSENFGINQIGRVFHESKLPKRDTGLDKAIYSLKRRGRRKVSYDEASSIVAVNTSLSAVKSGIKRLGIITADKADAINTKIIEALQAEGVEGVVLSELLYSNREMSQLKDVDAALIIARPGVSRYDDLWDIIDVLDNQKVKILGGIIA